MTDIPISDVAGPPDPITSDLIVKQAQHLFRNSLDRTGHVWVIAFCFQLIEKFDPWAGSRLVGTVFVVVAPLVAAWISAAGARGLLLDRRLLWALNPDFFRYLGTSLLLVLPIAVIGLLAGRVSTPANLLLYLGMIVLLVFMLRYLLWPMGLLLGYRNMSASESARLMNGRIASFVGASLQVAIWIILPFLVISVGTIMLPASTRTVTRPLLLALDAIVATLITIGNTSLWSAMYLLTVRRADSSHDAQGS